MNLQKRLKKPLTTLERLFEWQAGVLIERHLAHEREILPLLKILRRIEEKVLPGKDKVQFLLVVPKPGLTVQGRMQRVWRAGINGMSHLVGKTINITPVPSGPYLAVDVLNGKAMSSMTRNACSKRIKEQNRLPCTALEGVTWATFNPEVFSRSLVLLGSRQGTAKYGCVPWLGMGGPTYPGVPKLYYDSDLWVGENQGPASCRMRLGLRELVIGGEKKCHPYY